MSKYWGYCCKDCGTHTDHWFNRGQGPLVEYYQAYQLLMVKYQWAWVSLDLYVAEIGDRVQMDSFLSEHAGHAMALHSEYGDIEEIPPLVATHE